MGLRMNCRWLLASLLTMAPCFGADLLRRDDFVKDMGNWMVEQMPGGRFAIENGALTIEDAGGCTVWWREKLTAPVLVTYEATVVAAGGPFDRVSDLNCFWMATDPTAPANLFTPIHPRTGRFEDYDLLQTYYVGLGGNENTTTRFRRYAGGGLKPLLPEHDRREREVLLEGNRPYRIEVMVLADGTVRYCRDQQLIFEYRDPAPLKFGWFGIRTVRSHLRIRDFQVRRP